MLRDEVPKHLRWDSSRFALRMTLFQQNLVSARFSIDIFFTIK